MVTLTEIITTKKAYTDSENELLYLGIFQDKKLNPRQRSLDALLENRLSRAIELDRFIGGIDQGVQQQILPIMRTV